MCGTLMIPAPRPGLVEPQGPLSLSLMISTADSLPSYFSRSSAASPLASGTENEKSVRWAQSAGYSFDGGDRADQCVVAGAAATCDYALPAAAITRMLCQGAVASSTRSDMIP